MAARTKKGFHFHREYIDSEILNEISFPTSPKLQHSFTFGNVVDSNEFEQQRIHRGEKKALIKLHIARDLRRLGCTPVTHWLCNFINVLFIYGARDESHGGTVLIKN